MRRRPSSPPIGLLIVAGFGVRIPIIRETEPGRFLVPAIFFLAPLAGAGVRFFLVKLRGVVRGSGSMQIANAAVAVVLLVHCRCWVSWRRERTTGIR